jgi:formiminotetrahydrofolate cyclodeaminase
LLVDLTITEFLDKMASGQAVPGGGSAAAFCAAMAAGLTEMTANLTIGKKGYEAVDADMRAIADRAFELRKKMIRNIDRDPEAFNQVISAFRMPKDNIEDISHRDKAIQEGFRDSTIIQLEVANGALEIMELALDVMKQGNRNAVNDGAAGAMLARTACITALSNVRINLKSIQDAAFVNEISDKVKELEEIVNHLERNYIADFTEQ